MTKSLICIILLIFCTTVNINAQQTSGIISDQPGYIKDELIYSLDNKPTPQCHASTIEETKTGLVASWFGGTEEKNPDVGIWVSRYINNEWTKPVEVADGVQNDGTRFPCWNPVLFYTQEGVLILFYKVGPDPVNWWGMLIKSTDDGATWLKPEKLPEGFLGPIKNKPVQLADGKIMCPSSTEDNGWKIHFEITDSKTKNWEMIKTTDDTSFFVIQPSVLFYGKDTLQALCRSKEGFITQCRSYDNGKTWGKMSNINLPNPNSGIDAVTLKNGLQLVVYNHTGMIQGRHRQAKAKPSAATVERRARRACSLPCATRSST